MSGRPPLLRTIDIVVAMSASALSGLIGIPHVRIAEGVCAPLRYVVTSVLIGLLLSFNDI